MLYQPIPEDQMEWSERIEANWEQLETCDQQAKKKGKLVGRYLNEPYADGYAYYQIVKENKKTVRVRVCVELGDDWVLPMWGEEATIPLEYAAKRLNARDYWESYKAK